MEGNGLVELKGGYGRREVVYILITPTHASCLVLVGQREAIHRYPHLASAFVHLFLLILFLIFVVDHCDSWRRSNLYLSERVEQSKQSRAEQASGVCWDMIGCYRIG